MGARPLALLALLVLAPGCALDPYSPGPGGPSDGSADLVATGDLPLLADWGSWAAGPPAACPSGATLWALLTATPDASICGWWQAGEIPAGIPSVAIFLASTAGGEGTPVPLGVYPVAPAPRGEAAYALVAIGSSGADCTPGESAAVGGAVEVTAADGSTLQGTVIAYLPDGGEISGSFAAPGCPVSLAGDACAGEVAPAGGTCVQQ